MEMFVSNLGIILLHAQKMNIWLENGLLSFWYRMNGKELLNWQRGFRFKP
jgi:hypothetical protein